LPFMFLWSLIYRVFQIREKMGGLIGLALGGIFLNGLLNYIFVLKLSLGISGICLGTFFAYLFLCALSYLLLAEEDNKGGKGC